MKCVQLHNVCCTKLYVFSRDTAEVFIDSEEWMTAMKCEFKNPATGIKDTPLRMLIKSFPDLAKKVFDKCMKSNLLSYGNDTSEV